MEVFELEKICDIKVLNLFIINDRLQYTGQFEILAANGRAELTHYSVKTQDNYQR